MNYMVMECRPSYAVLLDEEGRFLKAANLSYEVGQTVCDPVLMREEPARQRRAAWWISSGIAAVAACLLLVFGLGYYQNYMAAYSSIYLSINPQVQMDLNRQGTVVALEGANPDGEKLLEGYNGRGKDKVTVADELIDRAIDMGYLSEGGQVSFSIDSPDDALFQAYGSELRTRVTEYLDGRLAVTIEILNYKDGRPQETPASSQTPSTSAAPASSAGSPPVSVQPAAPSDGQTDYGDTDYGPGSDGNTGYTPPAASPASQAPADTDYGPGNDGDTGYTPPAASAASSVSPAPADTDYGPGNDGVTDYVDGNTDYDPGHADDGDDDDDNDDDGDDDDSDDDGKDDD